MGQDRGQECHGRVTSTAGRAPGAAGSSEGQGDECRRTERARADAACRPDRRSAGLPCAAAAAAAARPDVSRLGGGGDHSAHGDLVDHRGAAGGGHRPDADRRLSPAGRGRHCRGRRALCAPADLPLPRRVPHRQGRRALEPASPHRPHHPERRRRRAEPAGRRIHAGHRRTLDVAQQHRDHHHDGAHRARRGGAGRQERGTALRRRPAAGDRLCRQHRRHGHADRHAAQRLAGRFPGGTLRHRHRLRQVDALRGPARGDSPGPRLAAADARDLPRRGSRDQRCRGGHCRGTARPRSARPRGKAGRGGFRRRRDALGTASADIRAAARRQAERLRHRDTRRPRPLRYPHAPEAARVPARLGDRQGPALGRADSLRRRAQPRLGDPGQRPRGLDRRPAGRPSR